MSHVRNGVSLAVAALALTVGCSKKSGSSASDSANGAVSSSAAPSPDTSAMAQPNSTAFTPPIDSTATKASRVSAALPGTKPMDTGMAHSSASSSASSSDATILSTAADVDSAEVMIARFAETKATRPSVKTYAHMLVMDHEHALHAVDSTASKLSFGTPMVSGQVAGASGIIAQLRTEPSGITFDTAFVNLMVSAHRTALATAQHDERAARKTSVKDDLREEVATMQKHLDRGIALQAELAKNP